MSLLLLFSRKVTAARQSSTATSAPNVSTRRASNPAPLGEPARSVVAADEVAAVVSAAPNRTFSTRIDGS